MTVTVGPVSTIPPPTEDPQTIYDIIKENIKNLLDITNSIGFSDQIVEILTDSNRDKDGLVFEFLSD
ncbi:hypothetical protein [Candidatus Nitrosocosmicus sp. R]